MGNIGQAYCSLGETSEVIEYCGQALTIAREIGDRNGEGTALWNMSLALEKSGKCKRAIEFAQAALEIYEQIESPYADVVRQTLKKWQK